MVRLRRWLVSGLYGWLGGGVPADWFACGLRAGDPSGLSGGMMNGLLGRLVRGLSGRLLAGNMNRLRRGLACGLE